jgi:hypothetical protein
MRSFSILRTNTGLTTNLKIMVDSNYNLFLESIESNAVLASSKYKKIQFIKDSYYDDLIPYFYTAGFKEDILSVDKAFDVKYSNDDSSMSSDFSKQYDDTYQMGARNISDNKNYEEEFECFAPLYINNTGVPKAFAIFRVDGPGLISLNKDNFRSEIINNFKCVKIFDLSKATPIGQWIDSNFISNESFPATPFELDYRRLEFSQWNGISYETGGYTYKAFFLDETLENENPLFDLEQFVFNGFKNNKVVFSQIVNFSFLFDDIPSTPTDIRKWSINRYYGFYLDDMYLSDSVVPYPLHKLKNDITISTGNVITSISGGSPFVEKWNDQLVYYVEYKGNLYQVVTFIVSQPIKILPNVISATLTIEEPVNVQVINYKIISDIDLTGKELELNSRVITIDNNNAIVKSDMSYYQIDGFDSADVWLIQINDQYHNLISDGSKIKINTDFSFRFSSESYQYWINSNGGASYSNTVSLIIDANNPPANFKIFKLDLTDIKDFDTSIIDTEYSKFEYEKSDDITITDEPKMYVTDHRSTTNPKHIDDFIYKEKVVNIPTSSEYTANYETFRIKLSGTGSRQTSDLTELWRKNAQHCRWVYQDSLSANDYPYLMNNSTLFEDYNRTVNTFDPDPKRIERNLDYFYTINSSTTSYTSHTLHVENNTGGVQDTNFEFEVDKYLNVGTYSNGTYSFDYFSYFFDRKTTFDSGNLVKGVTKYSVFNTGTSVIPNTTVFKGLKFRMYDVETIQVNQGVVENVNLKNSNAFENFKFSILLSSNNFNVSDFGGVTQSSNNMQWNIIENWEMDKNYATGSIVILDDILYQSIADTISSVPVKVIGGTQVKSSPYNDSDWMTYTYSYGIVNTSNSGSPFWNPNYDNNYIIDDVVYNSGEYYSCDNISSTSSFWNPNLTYYTGDTILFKNKYYTSNVSNNNYPPNIGININLNGVWTSYWEVVATQNPKWAPINLWNPGISYYSPQYVVHNDVVYHGVFSGTASGEPGVGPNNGWSRVYSIKQDPNYIYNISSNPFIGLNNKIYLITSNSNNSTLENGINIYINKLWKNILINIYINDNTSNNLSGVDRDELYTDLNKKLTAQNFISCINDLSATYGFSDYMNYVVIDENGIISKYNLNSNISNLGSIIFCESPDELLTKVNSMMEIPITLSNSIITPVNVLNNGDITNLSELNYYSGIPVAIDLVSNKEDRKIVPSYHGIVNIVNNQIYRHSGYYMPLFYSISLFSKPGLTSSLIGNYKFDTDYNDFGIIKQRIISKVNRKGSILKLSNNNSYKSIYPMLDEFGYTFTDFFIFKSTWDLEYHLECTSIQKIKTKAGNNLQLNIATQIINTNKNLSL